MNVDKMLMVDICHIFRVVTVFVVLVSLSL